MLSNDKIWPGLATHFVAVRLDWEQGNHYRDKFGFVLGTGDQLFLDSKGELIPPAGDRRVYGRHGENITPGVIARVRKAAASEASVRTLKLEWFFWPRKNSAKRQGGFYPPPVPAIAQFARLPIAEVSGPLPDAFADSEFLRRHVRQFIWKRGMEEGESVVRLSRIRDGLPEGLPTELAELRGGELEPAALGKALDRAWLTYMKDRPRTAQGYLENEHGGWMRGMGPQMLEEDARVRESARAGTLLPPGRGE